MTDGNLNRQFKRFYNSNIDGIIEEVGIKYHGSAFTMKGSAEEFVFNPYTDRKLNDDKVFGYYGDFIKGGRSVSVGETGDLITDGWEMFSKDSLVIVIKPAKEASYKATVDILDQMTNNHIEKYSMTDLDKKEKEFLKIAE